MERYILLYIRGTAMERYTLLYIRGIAMERYTLLYIRGIAMDIWKCFIIFVILYFFYLQTSRRVHFVT